jgi:hypothetical protein
MDKKEKKGISTESTERGVCELKPPSGDKDINKCPYCGLRFENPPEVILHVFRQHSS